MVYRPFETNGYSKLVICVGKMQRFYRQQLFLMIVAFSGLESGKGNYVFPMNVGGSLRAIA